jgi:hypothetical protein
LSLRKKKNQKTKKQLILHKINSCEFVDGAAFQMKFEGLPAPQLPSSICSHGGLVFFYFRIILLKVLPTWLKPRYSRNI